MVLFEDIIRYPESFPPKVYHDAVGSYDYHSAVRGRPNIQATKMEMT